MPCGRGPSRPRWMRSCATVCSSAGLRDSYDNITGYTLGLLRRRPGRARATSRASSTPEPTGARSEHGFPHVRLGAGRLVQRNGSRDGAWPGAADEAAAHFDRESDGRMNRTVRHAGARRGGRRACRRRCTCSVPGDPVTVIDPLPPGGGASFGNAGPDQRRHLDPDRPAGHAAKVPGWLTDRLGPLSVDPLYFPKALPWLLRWIEASRMPRVLKISDAMRALHRTTFDCWKELLGQARFYDLIRPNGQVHVWESEAETPGAALERSLRERQGIRAEPLTADDLRQMFPGIAPENRSRHADPWKRLHREPAPSRGRARRIARRCGRRDRCRASYEDHSGPKAAAIRL